MLSTGIKDPNDAERIARWFLGTTCGLMLLTIIVGSCYLKINSAPLFVKKQILMIGLSNLGGLLFASFRYDIFETKFYFVCSALFLGLYYAGSLISTYYFAYRYLLTSRKMKLS